MRRCIEQEKANAESLLIELKKDAKVGFEASNHYAYTQRNLLEKILRMDEFLEKLI